MSRWLTCSLRLLVTALVAVASAAVAAQPARAAMCCDLWTDPAQPVQQAPTKVVAKEQWAVLTGDTFDLVARREGSADIPIRLSRDAPGSLTWTGQAVFPTPGEWKLRVAIAVPENHYPCFERAASVVASSAEQDQSEPASALPAMAAVAAMLALIAATVALTISQLRKR